MVKVSVIIPNYNHSLYLEKRIDSVLQQTYQDFEVIILDDSSTDGSRVVIESYRQNPKVSHIVYNNKNSGSTFRQWRKGIKMSLGKYIWIAESDDYAEKEFLEKLCNLFTKHENIGIVFSNSNWVDSKNEIGKSLSIYNTSFIKEGHEEIVYLLKNNTIQNASSALIRSDLARVAINGLDKFKACGDWLFYIRVLQNSNVCYTNEKLNNFRWYHNNISNNAEKKGVWISEGVMVLSSLNPGKLVLGKRQLINVYKEWYSRIMNAESLSVLNKTKSLLHLNYFFARFLFRFSL